MAFIDLSRDLFENVTISLTPKVTYTSGSTAGITGSAYLMPLKSKRIKEIRVMETPSSTEFQADASNIAPGFDEVDAFRINSLSGLTQQVNAGNPQAIANLKKGLERYMIAVNASPFDVRYDKNLPITRIEQPTTFSTASVMKRYIKDNLMPYYRTQYDDCGFYYRNYHTLNFFTGSNFNTGSVLIYPNSPTELYNKGNEFTLQFWINPRYQNEKNKDFHAGTIFHLSSSIAVSLITGSQKDQNGLASSFKILGQFYEGTRIQPDQINFNSSNYYVTSSIELKYNHWHHVSMRWSNSTNDNTGSLIVDGKKSDFVIPDSVATYREGLKSPQDIKGICIGNFYKGSGGNLGKFNNSDSHSQEGTVIVTAGSDPLESNYSFDNPLNAEIHEIKFYNSYLNDNYIVNSGSGVSRSDISDHKLRFYLPPYFYPESFKSRRILYSPEFKVTTSSYTATNNLFAFSVNGKEINLENFTREMTRMLPPRHFHLTASTAQSFESVDQFMFDGANAKRNFTILPNDNGLFKPDYHIIETHVTGTVLAEHYTGKSYNNTINNYDLIKMENALTKIAERVELHTSFPNGTSLTDFIFGGSPQIGIIAKNVQDQITQAINNDRQDYYLATLYELKEDSSNYVSIFNISNLYYGNQIKHGSFQITDASLTGSQDKIGMTLKDNGRGGVYRADCLTKQADWNAVGNLFYDEGLLMIKSPHLSLYGKDHFETSFKGEHNIHSLVINVPAQRGFFDKSVNPSFVSLPKSENLNDEETETIAITGVNIHDENFNIIMRANLAQPIIKDKSDEFVIRLKMDF